jgi:ornithine cyclodeaminase
VRVLVLSHDDVVRLLSMEECVEAMEDALAALARGEAHQPLRFVVRPPDAPGLLGLMPAYRPGAWGLKEVCVYPQNSARGLDPHQGAVLLHDGETGVLRAIVSAGAVTAVRTAAVSAAATRWLAARDARTVAILGAGIQARSHLEAMLCVLRPERVRIWSRTHERAQELWREATTRFHVPCEVADTAEDAVRGADVVCTCTAAREPVVRAEWLAETAHVNAVGASIPTARELDSAAVARAALFVDRRESALAEAGDYVLAAAEGAVGPEHIRAELGEVIAGLAPGRRPEDGVTVFKSVGLAVEDLAAAVLLERKARRQGVGTEVEL